MTKKIEEKNKSLHNTPHLAVHWFSKLFSTSSWCCVFFIYNLRHRWKQERIDCKKEFLASTLIANIASYMKIFFFELTNSHFVGRRSYSFIFVNIFIKKLTLYRKIHGHENCVHAVRKQLIWALERGSFWRCMRLW